MAGLLLGLRRQRARNRQKAIHETHKPAAKVYTLETPEEKESRNIMERTVNAVSKEDFLLNQIDEFRERAKQLQNLLNTRETEADELETLVNERQEKADELGQILKERQEKADGITAEVERQIDSLIEKVAAKMDEIEASMKADVADGKEFNEKRAEELKESLAQIEEQLTLVKNEVSEKVHTENVKSYRNIAELFKNMEEKIEEISVLGNRIQPVKGITITALIFAILNFIAIIGLFLVNLGVFSI